MKNFKNLRFIICSLLSCLAFAELQYCSQDASAAVALRVNTESKAWEQQQKEDLQDALSPRPVKQKRERRKSLVLESVETTVVCPVIDNFIVNSSEVHDLSRDPVLQACDAAIVAYWMSPKFLTRIEMNEKSLKLPTRQILYDVVKIDDTLQKNKSSMKDSLYRAKLADTVRSKTLTQDTKRYILESIQADKTRVVERLWLEHLYAQVDLIHKQVEKKEIAYSYYAWPYIREIHQIKKFPTAYGNQVSR